MNINADIAKTYIVSNKRLTAVAALGVLLGMSVYIFMNSMMVGFDRSANESIFRSTPHIRVYKEDIISQVLVQKHPENYVIINPKIVPKNNRIINPNLVCETISKEKDVTVVTPQVNTSVFYNNGKSQITGLAIGILPNEANQMYNISSFMVEGSFDQLKSNMNGIIIGSGIANKMNVAIGDNINLTSSKGVNRTFKIIGIFKSNNSKVDKVNSYINLSTSQQLLKEGNNYITDINVNIKDPEQAEQIAKKLAAITGYNAEGWKQTNETLMAAFRMRRIVINFVSLTILLVAGFGIYNILNMTVTQKINDIAKYKKSYLEIEKF
jgi:lipoprotein-releasing system permease protein